MLVLSLGAAELGVSDLVIYLTTEANTNEEDKTHCTAHTPANDPAIPTSKLNQIKNQFKKTARMLQMDK